MQRTVPLTRSRILPALLLLALLAGPAPSAAQRAAGADAPAQERDAADAGHGQGAAAADVDPYAAGRDPVPPPLPEPGPLARVFDHPEERQVEIRLGPVRVEPGAHLRVPIQLVRLPLEGWLHGFEWSVTDGEGEPLPEDFLHHVNLIDPDARELFAPIARRVMAAGRETRSQRMPRLIGYPVREGTRLLVAAMLSNDGREPIEAVVHVRLDYSLDEDGWIDPRAVYPFYMDVMGPVGPKDFAVPPGRTVKSWEARPAIGGRVMALGGHVHDYAEELRLIDVTSGDTIWRRAPRTDDEGRVVSVPSGKLWWRGGAKIHTDHTYRIEVVYENPTGRPAPDGGMGAIGGVVLAPNARWPELDRRDRQYLAELRDTLTAPERLSGHGHGHGRGHGQPATEETDTGDGHRHEGR